MAKFKKRLEARQLRKEGYSIRSIAQQLDVSKASASTWCQDLQLTKKQEERLMRSAIKAGHLGRLKGALANKTRKEQRIQFHNETGKKLLQRIHVQEFLIAGLALYWGEGNKKSRLSFINSDPAMIQFMLLWFQKAMGVKREDFMPCVFINAIHKPRINKIVRFWSNLLELPPRQFSNPVFIKRNPRKVYENYDSYYGLLAIRVRKSTDLKYRILGLIEGLKGAQV